MSAKPIATPFYIPTPRRVAMLLIVAAMLFGLNRAWLYLAHETRFFRVSRIAITGTKYLPESAILKRAAIPEDTTLYAVDLDAVTARLLENPYVRGVSVTRGLPSSILIDVEEREPLFYLVDRKLYMVDAYGVVLEKLPGMPVGHLPMITGLTREKIRKEDRTLNAAIDMVLKIREVDTRLPESLFALISEINFTKRGRPELVLVQGGARVDLGEDRHYERLYLLGSFLLGERPYLQKLPDVKRIDMTVPDRIIVRRKSS